MPPKAKFTREEILSKAFEIVKKEGAGALTARSLGKALGCSPRPVFTVFSGMEEVVKAVEDSARCLYTQYVDRGLSQSLPFKGVGEAYIKFAIDEPRLFELLFMSTRESVPPIERVLSVIDVNYERIMASVRDEYRLDEEQAIKLYRHMWIYTHGVSTLIVTHMCAFSQSDISDMLTQAFVGILTKIKTEARQ